MMVDQSQTCPSCRSSKYSNPQLKLMVNTCGHSLCENCVEVLFVRGSALCVQCKVPLRKVNFRYQLFEDPLVQKEVDIRKRVLSDFNKREDDFSSLEEYDLYLEKIEELIYNLTNDIDVEDCKRYIEAYKKENKDTIKKNRLRPSASMLFYESELERESMLREQREKEDEENRQNLIRGSAGPLHSNANDSISNVAEREEVHKTCASSFGRVEYTTVTPATMRAPISSTTPKPIPQPPSQFYAPASAMSNRMGPDRVFVPPPPSALGTGYLAPPSSLPPVCPPSVGNWTTGTHHQIHLPPRTPQLPRQPDTVLIPTRSQSTRSSSSRSDTGPLPFIYEPYEFDINGPAVPTPGHTRWPDIVRVYTCGIVSRLVSDQADVKPTSGDTADVSAEVDDNVKSEITMKTCHIPVQKYEPMDLEDDGFDKVAVKKEEYSESHSPPLIGSAHQLPSGACGIAPVVFLERCLQESRCGLFL